MKGIVRKEIHLEPSVITRLQDMANKKQLSLKPFMESVLIKESNKVNKTKTVNHV